MPNKLLIICLLIGVVSCTREISLYNQVDNDVTYTEGSVTVYLDGMGTVTRSTWDYDNYFHNSDIFHADSKHERGFYNRLLVSFDSDFLLEYYSQPTYGVNNSFSPPAIDNLGDPDRRTDEYTAVALGAPFGAPLTTGAHYFYVLCNLPQTVHETFLEWLGNNQGILTKDEFEQTLLDYPLEELAKKFEGYDYLTEAHNTQRCMMTNITSPAPDYMASKDQNSPGYYPSTNNTTAYIGKIFAKASLAYVEANGKLSDVSYRVVNVPKKVYLMPNIFDEQVEPPHYNIDFQNNYETSYNEWFDERYKLDTDEPDWQEAIVNTTQEKTYVYCMENGNQIPLQGNSTFLLVKGKYTPDAWIDKNGNPTATPGNEGTFWRIKLNGRYRPGYYNEEPVSAGAGYIEKYEGGITYYPIWLQTDGKYQVKRNGFYKIALTEVLSAGASTPQSSIDPASPIESPAVRNSLTKSGGSNSPEIITDIKWEQGGF